jgi:hypothetical protein
MGAVSSMPAKRCVGSNRALTGESVSVALGSVMSARDLDRSRAFTHNGLLRRAERGLAAGGRPCAYRTEEDHDRAKAGFRGIRAPLHEVGASATAPTGWIDLIPSLRGSIPPLMGRPRAGRACPRLTQWP